MGSQEVGRVVGWDCPDGCGLGGDAGVYQTPDLHGPALSSSHSPAEEGPKEIQGTGLEGSCSQGEACWELTHELSLELVSGEQAGRAGEHNLLGQGLASEDPSDPPTPGQGVCGIPPVILHMSFMENEAGQVT